MNNIIAARCVAPGSSFFSRFAWHSAHYLILCLPVAAALIAPAAHAQVSITTSGTAVTQNFDTLANTGTANAWTDNSTLPGWYATYTGGTGSFPGTYRADTGSSNTGALYSYGSSASTERALGSTSSGTPGTIIYAWRLVNNTGAAITSLAVNYNGEQWRNGGNATQQKLTFEYQIASSGSITGANTPSTGWVGDANLDFTGPIATAVSSALDGNAAANRVAITDTLTVSIPAGSEIWLRWSDVNDTGNDHGLAIDDLSVTAGGSSGTPSLTINNVSQPEGNSGTTAFVFTVSLSAASASTVTVNYATADVTATAGSDYTAVSGTLTFAPGETTKTLVVLVNGDTAVESDETFNINLSGPTNATIATATGTGTIVNDDTANYTIMQIQGHGAASPYSGQTVTTIGTDVVTAVKSNGFFMQDFDGDGDVTTSDAIYVYTSSTPTVSQGDVVSVKGTVAEYQGSTEMTSPTVTVISNGHALPAAYVYSNSNKPSTDPTAGICMGSGSTVVPATDGYMAGNFACLDAMLVTIQNGIATGPTGGNSSSDGVHAGTASFTYVTVDSLYPVFRAPGAIYPGLSSVPGASVFDGNPEVIEVYYSAIGTTAANASTYFSKSAHIYNSGQPFSDVTGIVQGYLTTYELYPLTMTASGSAPTYPVAVADSPAGTLTVATQNMLHFFNNTADGYDTTNYNDTCAGTGASDQCPTAAEYAIRLTKMSLQVRTVLKSPVIFEAEEVENLSTAQDLADQIGTDGGPTYVPYLIPGNDSSGINIAVFVQSAVTVNSVQQLYKNSTTTACSGTPPCLLNDRPPVLVDATYNGYRFYLLAIYDRSLSNLGVSGYDYVGQKRSAQAAQIASIVQAIQTGSTLTGAVSGTATPGSPTSVTSYTAGTEHDLNTSAGVPLIVTGDFNAYEFSDGYVDVTGLIMGTASQSANEYWPSSSYFVQYPAGLTYSAPNPVLTDTGIHQTALKHYSYNFDGFRQEIDHILVDSIAAGDFVQIGNAQGNSDVSEAGTASLDSTTAARTSDHDGQVVTLGYTVTPSAGSGGTISPSTVQLLSNGKTSTITITANTGYVPNVAGSCGGSLSQVNSNTYTYATSAVTANCTVDVSFTQTFTVTATVSGSGGSASPATQVVNSGDTAIITATPNSGYVLSTVSGDTCTVSTSGTTITTGTITSDCTVTVKFLQQFTVTAAVSGSGGSVSPTSQIVNSGDTASIVATPDSGYSLTGVSAVGCSASYSGTTITTGAVGANCAVTATFTASSGSGTTLALSYSGTTIPAGDTTPSTTEGTNFGSTIVGTPVLHTFTISNPSAVPAATTPIRKMLAMFVPSATIQAAGDITINSITSTNAAFTTAGGTGVLAQGSSTTFSITFDPASTGTKTGTITVTATNSDLTQQTFSFAVTGFAAAADAGSGTGVVATPMLDARILSLLMLAIGALGLCFLPRRSLRK